jgi:hypothetical protein
MLRVRTTLFSCLTVLYLALTHAPATLAQTVTSGAITGRVQEVGTGTPIAGAAVTVTHEETGLTRSGVTDQNGNYFIRMLTIGQYTVTGTRHSPGL